ncbi:MAG: hypothetical protein NEA02_00690 [Thermoanaerobaculia bacterium]|nr:hypothetical protein [Thermoanaerobaculia bacterium]
MTRSKRPLHDSPPHERAAGSSQHNLPIGTQIKWNLMFHLPGTFYDPNERQTNSDFYLGHVEKAGGLHVEAKPPATPTPKPIH